MNAWGVDENHLRCPLGSYAKQPISCGLWFWSGDGEILSNQFIEQSGFAYIGSSNQADESTMFFCAHVPDAIFEWRMIYVNSAPGRLFRKVLVSLIGLHRFQQFIRNYSHGAFQHHMRRD